MSGVELRALILLLVVMHTRDGTEGNHVLLQPVQMWSNLFGRGQTCAGEGWNTVQYHLFCTWCRNIHLL